MILGYLLVFCVGTAGFFVCRRLHVPNPGLLGAMFFTAVLSVFGVFPPLVLWPFSVCANTVIGMMLAASFDRTLLKRIKAMLFPVLLAMVTLNLLSILCGLVFYHFSNADLVTSLIASSAGGISEMMIFALSTDADLAVVACVQVTRVVVFLSLLPFLKLLDKNTLENTVSPDQSEIKRFSRAGGIILVLIAFLGGLLLQQFNIPAANMLGAMFFAGVFALLMNRSYVINNKIRLAAQVCLGVVMGERITPEIVRQLSGILLPTAMTTLVMLCGCVLIGLMIRKLSGFPLITSLLCGAPAGLGQIVVIADEVGADILTASVFHIVRLTSIVSLYPWIIVTFSRLYG